MGQRGGSIKTALATLKVSRWPKRGDEIWQRIFLCRKATLSVHGSTKREAFHFKTRIVHKFSMEMFDTMDNMWHRISTLTS